MVLFFLVPFLWLTGCQEHKSPEAAHDQRLVVLSTTAMIGDIVTKIGGDEIKSEILIGYQLDPHSYELVKGDDEKLFEAGAIFYNGLGLEHGASLRRTLKTLTQAVALGDEIARENPSLILYEKGHPDPHIWMDVSLWKKIIHPIAEVLSQKDPGHRYLYETRAAKLEKELGALDSDIRTRFLSIPQQKRFLITSHDAFNYFARAYLATEAERQNSLWRARVLAPEGLAPDGQISLQDIQFILEKIKEHHISVIFAEAYVNQGPLKKIVSSASWQGLTIEIAPDPLYSDSLGAEGSGASEYRDMMSYNARVIEQSLKEGYQLSERRHE